MSEALGDVPVGRQEDKNASLVEQLSQLLAVDIEKLLHEMEEYKPKLVYAGYYRGHAVVVVEGHDSKDMNLPPVCRVMVGKPGELKELDTTRKSGGSIRVLSYPQYEKAYDYKEPDNIYTIVGVTKSPRGRMAHKLRISKPDENGHREAEWVSRVYTGAKDMSRIEYADTVSLRQFIPQEKPF